ncbi:MAG: EF-hand domain-containing protein [Pelagimonas sp.]|jgi:Ca2+-binding EF-hand superfamily protein|nr:EF-hand domain-containing protein [Pelagimonas sp.]
MKTLAITCAIIALPVLAIAEQGQPGAHFIENWDQNADGSVTLSELTERRSDVFASFDADEDGFIDSTEYKLFDAARAADMAEHGGHGAGMMKRAADGMTLAANDTDQDGKVSLNEFLTGATPWFDQLDSNGDGAITTADFGRGRGMGTGKGGQGKGGGKG